MKYVYQFNLDPVTASTVRVALVLSIYNAFKARHAYTEGLARSNRDEIRKSIAALREVRAAKLGFVKDEPDAIVRNGAADSFSEWLDSNGDAIIVPGIARPNDTMIRASFAPSEDLTSTSPFTH